MRKLFIASGVLLASLSFGSAHACTGPQECVLPLIPEVCYSTFGGPYNCVQVSPESDQIVIGVGFDAGACGCVYVYSEGIVSILRTGIQGSGPGGLTGRVNLIVNGANTAGVHYGVDQPGSHAGVSLGGSCVVGTC